MSAPVLSHSGGDDTDRENDAKVARHELELAERLSQDIRAAGEGGWRSQWYTGTSAVLPSDRRSSYGEWRLARNEWTQTGNPGHLERMLSAVSFTIPPHSFEVPGSPPVPGNRVAPFPFPAVIIALALVTLVLLAIL